MNYSVSYNLPYDIENENGHKLSVNKIIIDEKEKLYSLGRDGVILKMHDIQLKYNQNQKTRYEGHNHWVNDLVVDNNLNRSN